MGGKSSTLRRQPLTITPPSLCSQNWRSLATPERTCSSKTQCSTACWPPLASSRSKPASSSPSLSSEHRCDASQALFNCAVVLHHEQARGGAQVLSAELSRVR